MKGRRGLDSCSLDLGSTRFLTGSYIRLMDPVSWEGVLDRVFPVLSNILRSPVVYRRGRLRVVLYRGDTALALKYRLLGGRWVVMVGATGRLCSGHYCGPVRGFTRALYVNVDTLVVTLNTANGSSVTVEEPCREGGSGD